jgi:hypothetical protein
VCIVVLICEPATKQDATRGPGFHPVFEMADYFVVCANPAAVRSTSYFFQEAKRPYKVEGPVLRKFVLPAKDDQIFAAYFISARPYASQCLARGRALPQTQSCCRIWRQLSSFYNCRRSAGRERSTYGLHNCKAPSCPAI